MITPIIREDLLYYVWKTKTFDMNGLNTTDGLPIQILQFGNQNHDSGPDFSQGKIKIGDTLWVGNIEMHVYSSDWERHCHDIDKAYDNVILHVVFEHDKEVFTSTEHQIPCLELKDRIPHATKSKYAQLIANKKWIPCEKQLPNIDRGLVSIWLQRLAAERIEHKTNDISQIHSLSTGDWNETLYILLAKYMGARVNQEPFEHLARITPYKMIQKNRFDLLKVEALLFGQAGMLNARFEDEYFKSLKNEYAFLSKKYTLQSMDPISWKFSRMRPIGFPTIRLAQLAQLLYQMEDIFSGLILQSETEKVRQALKVGTSEYWLTHYRFGKASKTSPKSMGDGFIDQLIINVVSPVLFQYGKSIGQESFYERSILHLEHTRPESNKIMRGFKALGIKPKSASESQALLELKSRYCDHKQCASCSIGNSILKRPG